VAGLVEEQLQPLREEVGVLRGEVAALRERVAEATAVEAILRRARAGRAGG
jgi:prefoldin subunit 5